jgi:hypothetical protein
MNASNKVNCPMDASEFYRDPESVSQGDIFETVPHLFLKDRPKQIALMMAAKKAGCLVDEFCGPQLPKCGSEIVVPAPTRVGYAVLLSHSCEVDKDKSHRLIALVRQMDNLQHEEKETIRQNGKYACFYLPPLDGKMPESYIDFRRISSVGLEWLAAKTRQVSLSEQARRKMLLAMFLFFARLKLDDSVFNEIKEQEA